MNSLLYEMSVISKTCPSQFSRAHGDLLTCLCLSDQHYIYNTIIEYNNIKQREEANPHILVVVTKECLVHWLNK